MSLDVRAIGLSIALMIVAGAVTAHTQARRDHVLIVGWHDEFNSLDNWAPWTAFGGFDILRGDDGKLTVVLGKTSMHDTNFHNYRAGVYQDFDVDLAHYPVVAVRVIGMHNAATWDAEVGEYREESLPNAREQSHGGFIARPGNPKQLVMDSIGDCGGQHKPGLVFIRLQPTPYGSKGKQHVRLLLNANGSLQGYVDFAWVRFIRREDVARLRSHPDNWTIRLSEAIGKPDGV
jgi:hypothetical protein